MFAGHAGQIDVVWYSDDAGKTWRVSSSTYGSNNASKGTPGPGPYGCGRRQGCFDEPFPVELPNGRVQLNMRNDSLTCDPKNCCCAALNITHPRSVADSTDGGLTFGPVYQQHDLPEPTGGCQASSIVVGDTVLFCNPSSGSSNRSLLTLRRSHDSGLTYPPDMATLVWAGAGGYSCLTRLANSTTTVGLVFERSAPGCKGGSCRISFVSLPVLKTDDGNTIFSTAGPSTVAHCSSAVDCTLELQRALNKSGDLEIPALTTPASWVVQPLLVASVANKAVRLGSGCLIEARAGYFHGLHDMLITIRSATNITIGSVPSAQKPAELRMRKWDYLAINNTTGKPSWANYVRSEWRHALGLYGSSSIHVHNLVISQAGGDGIYVDGLKSSSVTSVLVCESFRNSLSIIAASGLNVTDCVFANISYSGGTAPRLGIDLEPNTPADFLEGILIRNCSVTSNYGGGFAVSVTGLSNLSRPIDVTFDQCTVNGAGCGGGFAAMTWRKSGTPSGTVRWIGGTISNTKNAGISISVPMTGIAVHVKDVRLLRTADGSAGRGWAPVSVLPVRNDGLWTIGGAHFSNVTVIDDVVYRGKRETRPFLAVAPDAEQVDGTFTVTNPMGCFVTPNGSTSRSTTNVTFTCTSPHNHTLPLKTDDGGWEVGGVPIATAIYPPSKGFIPRLAWQKRHDWRI